MARTILQLKQHAARNLHELETNPAFSAVVFPNWVTDIQNRIMAFKVWHWNTDLMALTWPAAVGEFSTLYLPEFIDKIYTGWPGTQVGRGKLEIVEAMDMDRWRPTSGVDVGMDYLVLYGYYGVENHLAADGVVTINSSAGAGNQVVLVEGLTPNDREQREEITVAGAGTTAGALDFKAGVGGVRRVTLIGDGTGTPVITTGIITATGDAGATNLFRCDSAYETSKEHQRSELYAVASATATFTIRYYRKIFPYTRDQDIVWLPEQFQDLMHIGIDEKIGFFRKKPEEVQYFRGLFQERLREMAAWDNRQPGKTWKVRVRRRHARRLR